MKRGCPKIKKDSLFNFVKLRRSFVNLYWKSYLGCVTRTVMSLAKVAHRINKAHQTFFRQHLFFLVAQVPEFSLI
jgi:hypothetical protein